MEKLKIAGIWVGVLEVELDNWTVPMLREEVAKRSSLAPNSINLICAGKLLKDGNGTEKLTQLGVKNNAKILASRVCVDEGKSLKDELMAEEERSRRLTRLKAAAEAVAKRNVDGSLPFEDFNVELENQNGDTVRAIGSETDKRALMMGLILHENAKLLIKRKMFGDALEVLTMGEEAFSLCDPKVIELIDNVPILQIDMVWCYFMLRDISWLSVAGVRLEKAREGLERSHGKDFSRVRFLQIARSPELALHLRLELLEGVVAFHSGQFDNCRKVLTSAKAKLSQLQVSDEALSLVMSIGFPERNAKRALRMSNQDVESAIDLLVKEKEFKAKKEEENIRRRNEIKEQKRYGLTALKKAVDLERLNELVSIGFEKDLAAEALRRNENDTQKALDDLTNPETNSVVQIAIVSRKIKRQRRTANAAVEELVSMGFERSEVFKAVQAGGGVEQALSQLLSKPESNPTVSSNNSSSSNVPVLDSNDDVNVASSDSEMEERDVEMEDELYEQIDGANVLSDYDIEVTIEGDAIEEYLALLASSNNCGQAASSSH
ncbi:UBA domain-containing protein [Cephalotus follicularis]|uniref:UBA domain-containing protein n=1 Tax=Cephalotus follicularis TaxID=3775 RepID=A0A1Q3CP96_CEPFO|nr:UBA domain-containing protein [Cephalotus follicularis]